MAARSKPEEVVRQKLLETMQNDLGFPREMLSVERSLNSMPHLAGQKVPDRRFDIVCFRKVKDQVFPLLLVECKAIPISKLALEQVIGYNHFAKAPFIAVANQDFVYTGFIGSGDGYRFEKGLFSYEKMGLWTES